MSKTSTQARKPLAAPTATRKTIEANTRASTDKAEADHAAAIKAAEVDAKNQASLQAVSTDPRDSADLGEPATKELRDAQRQASQAPAPETSRRRLLISDDDEMVKVFVPRGYNFTDDSGAVKRYEAGEQKMPASHAEHWYSKANGVDLKK